MSTFSVIIPCYKYGRYLPGCVASVLGQDDADVRALVIDDASPDDSAEVAAHLAERDGRLQVRRHAVNHGHIATYNEGLEWASGDYLLLISADDLLIPGALRRSGRLLDTCPNVGLTYGRQIRFQGDFPPTLAAPPSDVHEHQILRGDEFIATCCALGHNPVATPTAVVRTALQKDLGGYRAELPHTADLEMWLRFAARADVGVVNADQAFKREHPGNMQRTYLANIARELKQLEAAVAAFFQGAYAGRANAKPLWRQARQALAGAAFWEASHAFDRRDVAACRELLDYARSLDPELPASRQWARLRSKRLPGPALWSLLRPLVDRLRPAASVQAT
jgi:glycosyltransferase involved in cell wall biosynthesis